MNDIQCYNNKRPRGKVAVMVSDERDSEGAQDVAAVPPLRCGSNTINHINNNNNMNNNHNISATVDPSLSTSVYNNSNDDDNSKYCTTTNNFLAEIHAAITTKQRLNVLQRLIHHLHLLSSSSSQQSKTMHRLCESKENRYHNNNLRTNTDEITTGSTLTPIINALTLQLHHILHIPSGATITELDLVCHCLHLTLVQIQQQQRRQHTSSHRKGGGGGGATFQRIILEQGIDFIFLLSQAVTFALQKSSYTKVKHRTTATTTTTTGGGATSTTTMPSAIESIVSIFYMISSFCAGCALLWKCPHAMNVVQQLLVVVVEDRDEEVLGTWKNITYYIEDSRPILVSRTGFVSSLVATMRRLLLVVVVPHQQHHRHLYSGSTTNTTSNTMKAQQRWSAIVRNLVATVECRTVLAGHAALISIIIQCLTTTTTSATATTQESQDNSNNDTNRSTIQNNSNSNNATTTTATSPPSMHKDWNDKKRNLLHTLICLAMDHHTSVLLIFHGDGILIHILQRFLRDDTDMTIRKRTACLIRLLANSTTSVPLLLHNHTTLIHTLADTAVLDTSRDVRQAATDAFLQCVSMVHQQEQQAQFYPPGRLAQSAQPAPRPNFGAVLEALTRLAQQYCQSQHTRGRTVISPELLARALKEQSRYFHHRCIMTQRPILLQTLAEIALSMSSQNDDGGGNYPYSSSLSNTAATSGAPMDACCALWQLSASSSLTDTTTSTGDDTSDNKETTAALIVQQNRQRIATEPRVLDALVTHAAATTEEVVTNTTTTLTVPSIGYALSTLVHLVTVLNNRSKLARHGCLLATMIQATRSMSRRRLRRRQHDEQPRGNGGSGVNAPAEDDQLDALRESILHLVQAL